MMYKYLANKVEGEVKLLQTLAACKTIHHLIVEYRLIIIISWQSDNENGSV